jgi:hypothetical protein
MAEELKNSLASEASGRVGKGEMFDWLNSILD